MNKNKKDIKIEYGMSHSEFIENIKYDKTLYFELSPSFSNHKIISKGFGKIIAIIGTFTYLIIPLIFVPIVAYMYSNWYLLFGILFSYLSTMLEGGKIIKWIYAYCLIFFSWYWYDFGFHLNEYANLFVLCVLWGSLTYYILSLIEEDFVKKEIYNDSVLFNTLSNNRSILFVSIESKKKTNLNQL